MGNQLNSAPKAEYEKIKKVNNKKLRTRDLNLTKDLQRII